jgi:hypothetical protein
MTDDKDSAMLLPCESCATAPVHFENAYGTGYIIHCSQDEDCMVGPYVEMGTKEQSIAAWNTRQPAQSDALVGALAESDREFGPDWGWEEQAKALRAALEARGLEIKEKGQ